MNNRNSEIENRKSTILEERARALAHLPKEEAKDGSLHLVAFSLGEERYGIGVTLIHEIQSLRSQAWSRVPCTPDFIVGAINIRGRIYSLMDIGCFLGLPHRLISETAHVLLVRNGGSESKGEMELTILTDDLPQVVNVPLAEVQPASATISSQAQKYVHGVTDDMLIILDLEHLLSDQGIIVNEEV